MARDSKPYQRDRSANPDAPGSWKHDLHESARPSSLLNRISSSSSQARNSAPSLLSRMSGGKGRELLDTTSSRPQPKLHGFDVAPPVNPHKHNSGLELLPSSSSRPSSTGTGGRGVRSVRGDNRIVQSSLDAALGRQTVPRQVVVYPQPSSLELLPTSSAGSTNQTSGGQRAGVSIFGAARSSTWVRVEGLAMGTTAEDVASAFAPLPILTSQLSPIQPSQSVSVDLEFSTKQPAEEAVEKYNGAVADGGTLRVSIIKPLIGRMGGGGSGSGNGNGVGEERMDVDGSGSDGRLVGRMGRPASAPRTASRELLGGSTSGKLYSDGILASNPKTAVITLADETPYSSSTTGNWGRGSLVGRVGR